MSSQDAFVKVKSLQMGPVVLVKSPQISDVFFDDEALCKGVIQGLDWPQAM